MPEYSILIRPWVMRKFKEYASVLDDDLCEAAHRALKILQRQIEDGTFNIVSQSRTAAKAIEQMEAELAGRRGAEREAALRAIEVVRQVAEQDGGMRYLVEQFPSQDPYIELVVVWLLIPKNHNKHDEIDVRLVIPQPLA